MLLMIFFSFKKLLTFAFSDIRVLDILSVICDDVKATLTLP